MNEPTPVVGRRLHGLVTVGDGSYRTPALGLIVRRDLATEEPRRKAWWSVIDPGQDNLVLSDHRWFSGAAWAAMTDETARLRLRGEGR